MVQSQLINVEKKSSFDQNAKNANLLNNKKVKKLLLFIVIIIMGLFCVDNPLLVAINGWVLMATL